MSSSVRHLSAVQGQQFDWANDSVRILSPADLTSGNVTVVEDTLKPGFFLARHHHEKTTEIFFVVDGTVHFAFDDETFIARVGDTVNVSPGIRHEVSAPQGARIITIFSPGGFDVYLGEIKALADHGTPTDADYQNIAERFDIWQG
jgi:quercetin dioxygenase-like cupin family protein